MTDSSKPQKVYITNLNTFSTLIDRLCIENVKLSHFEFLLEFKDSNPGISESYSLESLHQKISFQHQIISVIKEEIVELLSQVLQTGKYDYIDESRTFRESK